MMQEENPPIDDAGLVDNLADGAGPTDAAEQPERRPSRKAAWLAMGAVALALGLIWIAPGIEEHADDVAAPGAAVDSGGVPVGKEAPLNFTLKDMHGANVSLASFKGKVILLNFWATWCGPCREEIPSLVTLQTKYADDLVVLGLSVDDPVEKLPPYAKAFKINYPLLVGKEREDVQDAFGPLWGIPVSVLIDRDGRIAKKYSGAASKEQFEREIKALL